MTDTGTHTKLDDGRHQVRFQRRLNHPIDRVWAAITEPDEIEAWLARAEIEPREGGAVSLEWLNTGDEEVVARGTVTVFDAPRRLELDTDMQGVLSFELREDGSHTELTFTATLGMPDEHATKNLAGWHLHLDLLADCLDGSGPVDWPHWPRERWDEIHERYEASMRPIS
jgi:uncharacterized protein YndB with AHSA1/START domain